MTIYFFSMLVHIAKILKPGAGAILKKIKKIRTFEFFLTPIFFDSSMQQKKMWRGFAFLEEEGQDNPFYGGRMH